MDNLKQEKSEDNVNEWLDKLALSELWSKNNLSSYEYYYRNEFDKLFAQDDFAEIYRVSVEKSIEFLAKHDSVFSESLLDGIDGSEIMKSTIRYYIMIKYKIKFAEDFNKTGYDPSKPVDEWYQK